MDALDLSLLDIGAAGRGKLAARFDERARAQLGIRIVNHALDSELLELARVFGRRLLALAELREVFVEQQRAMQGLSLRLLSVAGVALGVGANYFADARASDPLWDLSIEHGSRGIGERSRGFLTLRQSASGAVTAWVGPKLARLAPHRWAAAGLPALPADALSLRFDLDGTQPAVPSRRPEPARLSAPPRAFERLGAT